MKLRTIITAALLAFAGSAVAESQNPVWPAGAADESEPRVIAFYQAKCAEWARDNSTQDADRSAYSANCVSDAPEVWPVGYDKSSDD